MARVAESVGAGPATPSGTQTTRLRPAPTFDLDDRMTLGTFAFTVKKPAGRRLCEMLQQAEFFALFEQCLAADAENFGAAADFVARSLERRFDYLAFEIFERA